MISNAKGREAKFEEPFISCSKSLSTLLRGITPDIMAVFIV